MNVKVQHIFSLIHRQSYIYKENLPGAYKIAVRIEEESILIEVIDLSWEYTFSLELNCLFLETGRAILYTCCQMTRNSHETTRKHSSHSLWSCVSILCLLQLAVEYLAFPTFHVIPKRIDTLPGH